MTLVVTMTATTAAYAAQALKPSARVSGDGATEEAITLLSARPKDDAGNTHASIVALRNPTSLSLMLMSSRDRTPQESRGEAVRRYMEFEPDEPAPDESDEAARPVGASRRDIPLRVGTAPNYLVESVAEDTMMNSSN